MTEPNDLTRYNYYSGAQALGDVWTLKRGDLPMRCVLSTHSLGWELRLTAGSNLLRSQVCKSQNEVFTVSGAWRAEAESKGFA